MGSPNPSRLTLPLLLLFRRLSASIRLLMRRKWLSRRNTPEISFPKLAVGQASVGAGPGLPGKGAAARWCMGRGAGAAGPAPQAGCWGAEGAGWDPGGLSMMVGLFLARHRVPLLGTACAWTWQLISSPGCLQLCGYQPASGWPLSITAEGERSVSLTGRHHASWARTTRRERRPSGLW